MNSFHDDLVKAAEAVVKTLEMPKLVKQSKKNENAGFIDWRDWMILVGEVKTLRNVLDQIAKASSP